MDLTVLKMVHSTLNTIEVKGKENLSSLLGCIEALDTFIRMAELPDRGQGQEEGNGG